MDGIDGGWCIGIEQCATKIVSWIATKPYRRQRRRAGCPCIEERFGQDCQTGRILLFVGANVSVIYIFGVAVILRLVSRNIRIFVSPLTNLPDLEAGGLTVLQPTFIFLSATTLM